VAPPDVALKHYESQLRQAQATVQLAQRQWARMSLADLDVSWASIVRRLTITVASGMLGAAKAGVAYVPEALDDGTSAGHVAPAPFAQAASDGRPLDTLLYSAVVRVKNDLGSGVAAPQALDAGGEWLSTLVRTQVADAGRGATGVAIAATPRAGYTRFVTPPCCQRCAVLAGKFFRWNTGFQRHPKCDCRHEPTLEGHTARRRPFSADQIKDLTPAQRSAIADGANVNQVINSRRGRAHSGMTTNEGTTRQGYASYVRREVARQRGLVERETVSRGAGVRNSTRVGNRLTPEAIYRVTASREEAIRLLGLNGYIVGDIDRLAAQVA
jgi:hypothetical protein